MTEAEWSKCRELEPMLESLIGRASKRKCLLFQVGCCRRIWHLLTDDRSRRAVEVAEEYADGHATAGQLRTAGNKAENVNWAAWERFNAAKKDKRPLLREALAARAAMAVTRMGKYTRQSITGASGVGITVAQAAAQGVPAQRAEFAAQTDLLRCIFGPLSTRPVTLDPSWLTSTVTALAQAIYADRAFDRLPILADALEDADCTNQDILSHCRSGGEHVRGCWVVDLLLGRN
jgi:hypothetical protein